MHRRLSALLFLTFLAICPPSIADEALEGDYLYRFTTLRAAPGQFKALLDWRERVDSSLFGEQSGVPEALVMRHSQGDQWDLMLITPMESWSAWYTEAAVARRAAGKRQHAALLAERGALVAFEEDVFAYGPDWDAVQDAHAQSGLFHPAAHLLGIIQGMGTDEVLLYWFQRHSTLVGRIREHSGLQRQQIAEDAR